MPVAAKNTTIFGYLSPAPTMSFCHRRSMFIGAVVALTIAGCGLLSANAQNLIANGDFETGPVNISGTIPNWTIGGPTHVAAMAEGATSGSYCAAFNEGGNFEGDTLSQSFTTVPGQAYVLEFDSGIYGIPSGTTLQLRFQVIGNTTRLDETFPPPCPNTYDPKLLYLHHYYRPFTADSSTTTVKFTDVGLGNGSADTMLDSVSVTVAPTPTPAPTPVILPLVNGDFETGPFNLPGTVGGWIVSGNNHIESISQGATTPIHSAGFSCGGDSFGNILSQSFVTTPGQVYSLDFAAGTFGQRNGAPLQLQVQIIGSSPALNQTITPPDAFTFTVSAVVFQQYHYTFTASGTSATVQFMDLVGNNVSADLMLDSVSILPVPPTFSQWQSANFTVGQLSDPTISGWGADPDRDGIENGLEYYFRMNPKTGIPASDQPSLPTVGLSSVGSNTYLTFTYRRLLGFSGNAPVVAISSDLVNWDVSQSQIEQVGAAARADGFTDIVTVRLKTPINQGPIARQYFRLMLTQ